MAGDWQELAQTAVIGLIFAFLAAKLISTVIAFKEDNLRITRSPPSSPRAAARSPALPATAAPAPAPASSYGSDSDWEGVESTELDEEFSAASAFVAASGTSVPEEAQLRLYGLYKVATEGPCTAPQPSALKLKARAKW
jgi:hypothetical protein